MGNFILSFYVHLGGIIADSIFNLGIKLDPIFSTPVSTKDHRRDWRLIA